MSLFNLEYEYMYFRKCLYEGLGLPVPARALFSDRLHASKCKACGSGLGMVARMIGHRVFVEPCRVCGGHSRAFLEESSDA